MDIIVKLIIRPPSDFTGFNVVRMRTNNRSPPQTMSAYLDLALVLTLSR